METTNIREIPCFSIDKLISIFQLEKDDAHIPGCLVASRSASKNVKMPLSHPFSLNAFIMVLCEQGSLGISTNMKEIEIHENDLYINVPRQIMRATELSDCKLKFIVLDLDFIREMNMDIKPVAQKLIEIKNTQCLKLGSDSASEIKGIADAISAEIRNNERDTTSTEIIRSLIVALFFKIGRAIDRSVAERPVNQEIFDKNAGYFKEFMILLSSNFKKERSVGFYADRMHLSPKYFTTLIKRMSGHTAAEWINSYVILEAKNLLKYSTMNIQEIAYYLNFPNQSFFGKYFKHHTNMTPSEYRKSE